MSKTSKYNKMLFSGIMNNKNQVQHKLQMLHNLKQKHNNDIPEANFIIDVTMSKPNFSYNKITLY